jgi:hypothetical protein
MDGFTAILYHAHSGLRYLVLLAGLASFLYSIIAAVSDRPWDKGGRVLLMAFVGTLDLQLLLGLVLVFLFPFHAMLWGHIVLMVLAAAAAHFTSIRIRRRGGEPRAHLTAALGVAGTLVLIVGGITAIGRSVL